MSSPDFPLETDPRFWPEVKDTMRTGEDSPEVHTLTQIFKSRLRTQRTNLRAAERMKKDPKG